MMMKRRSVCILARRGALRVVAARTVEKYYANDIQNMTIAIYENYEEELIEDGYFEGYGSDQEDI